MKHTQKKHNMLKNTKANKRTLRSDNETRHWSTGCSLRVLRQNTPHLRFLAPVAGRPRKPRAASDLQMGPPAPNRPSPQRMGAQRCLATPDNNSRQPVGDSTDQLYNANPTNKAIQCESRDWQKKTCETCGKLSQMLVSGSLAGGSAAWWLPSDELAGAIMSLRRCRLLPER